MKPTNLVFATAFTLLFSIGTYAQTPLEKATSRELLSLYLENIGKPDQSQGESALGLLFERRDRGEQEAVFYANWLTQSLCESGKRSNPTLNTATAPACVSAYNNIRSIAIEEFPKDLHLNAIARETLAGMLLAGTGTTSSKILAAEWYTKAARSHARNSDRESAIRSIEKALIASPEFSPAKEMKDNLITNKN